MRILTFDIESAPNLADVWGLWNQNIGISQIRETAHLLSTAWKWHGERTIYFERGPKYGGSIQRIHELLDEADAVVTYNGDRYDIPNLNREFWLAGLGPNSSYASIDLLRTMRRQFRFSSNKLDHIVGEAMSQHKVRHDGHTLWVRCMAGDERAWKTMERYNKGDVRLTEKLYDKVLPWIPGHPNANLFKIEGEDHGCTHCGSTRFQKRGTRKTQAGVYQEYQCQKCLHYFRLAKREATTPYR